MAGLGLVVECLVKYTRWGLAERVGDVIYLNENLNKPYWLFLKDYLLSHELGHSSAEFTSFKDLKHDISASMRSYLPHELRFMIMYPRAWTQVLGVSFREGEVCIDWTNIIINVWVIGFLSVGSWYLGRVAGWW